MVFDYSIKDSQGRTLREGQIHVEASPMDQAGALAKALNRLSDWLSRNPLSKLPASITIGIAHV